MKTKVLLLPCLLVCAVCMAQLHYFLPRDNAVMSILDQKYWFEGDTIINNTRYTKVYRQFCTSETECGDLSYYAAVREDTIGAKIYCIQTYDGIERLIADFDVQVGDKITLCSYTMTPYWWQGEGSAEVIENEVRIDAIDSILIDNQYRKRVNFLFNDFWNYDSLVEGIGDLEHGLFFVFDTGMPDLRADPIFLCFHIDDILIYQAPYTYTCYLRDDGLDIKEPSHSDFAVYPTLVKDKLLIKTNYNFFEYKIYNSEGKLCMTGTLGNNTIDVSNLYPGIYYIVSHNNNIVYTNKFIKH